MGSVKSSKKVFGGSIAALGPSSTRHLVTILRPRKQPRHGASPSLRGGVRPAQPGSTVSSNTCHHEPTPVRPLRVSRVFMPRRNTKRRQTGMAHASILRPAGENVHGLVGPPCPRMPPTLGLRIFESTAKVHPPAYLAGHPDGPGTAPPQEPPARHCLPHNSPASRGTRRAQPPAGHPSTRVVLDFPRVAVAGNDEGRGARGVSGVGPARAFTRNEVVCHEGDP